jgi:hypothetical protein
VREEYAVVEAEPEPVEAPPPPEVSAALLVALAPRPEEISFRNGTAVRVAFISAALFFLLMTFVALAGAAPLQLVLSLVFPAAAGFYAVFLYRRRTGASLSVRSGARMGWLTGIFAFVISTVLFTLSMVAMMSRGGLAEIYRQNAGNLGLSAERVDEVVKLLENPAMVGLALVFFLLFQFMVVTTFSSAGGALGARVLRRD